MKLRYAVAFEQTPNNYSAYSPDLPGCVSTGKTWSDIHEMIRVSITLYLESLLEEGELLPQPQMSLEEAMTQHSRNLVEFKETLADFGEDESTLSTTFEMVEVEIVSHPAEAMA